MTDHDIPDAKALRTRDQLMRWREGMGLTQAETADALGMSVSAYGFIERTGKVDTRTRLAMRLLWERAQAPEPPAPSPL